MQPGSLVTSAGAAAATAVTGRAYLSVEGLTKSYGDRRVLDGLSFGIARGEIFGLLGPNGAGKTTTFQLLTGLQRPDAGTVHVGGVALAPGDRAFRAELGVVFQRASLDDKLTARENLDLGAALYALPRAVRARRVDELLALVELTDRADEPVERFSGGMRRRLELARALVHGPRVLVMDEPTQGVDEGSFRRIWRYIHELRRREGLTVLLTTHRPEEAENCDRLAVIDSGRLVAIDTPDSLKGRIGGDVVTLEADNPENLANHLAASFGVNPIVHDRQVAFEAARAHELIPRLVEAFPPGRIRSAALRRPTLADAFLKLTGRALDDSAGASEVSAA